MNEWIKKISDMVHTMNLSEGENKTKNEMLSLYRLTGKRIELPQQTAQYLFLIIDGSMRLHTPSGILDYVAGQYSISAIDTPTSGDVLSLSDSGEFLAVAVSFSVNDVLSVVIDLDGRLVDDILESRLPADVMSGTDTHVTQCVARLVETLAEPYGMNFIGNSIRREMIFYALQGAVGKEFLQSTIRIQQAGDIYDLNSWIKENYKESFTVEELAKRWNMSPAMLHQKFKSAVGMGLLQCQKRLRLTEARRLMLDEGKNVTEVSLEVGYESMSQFIREYKKMFGAAPKEDIQTLKRHLKK